METIITDDIRVAAELLRNGQLVAFPTETVFGLGADATNANAVQKIFVAKKRPADNPLIVHVASVDGLAGVVSHVPDSARLFMESFFPGPLTLILGRDPRIPAVVSTGLPTIGIRMPAHDVASELIRMTGRPVAAPSANLSGRPSPTTWESVREDLDGAIACILKGKRARVGIESTVVDCTTVVPTVLRAGSITLEALRMVVPETKPSAGAPELSPRSPGQQHRHYAPHAQVVLVDDPSEIQDMANIAYIGQAVSRNPELYKAYAHVDNLDEYAHRIFEFLRECDRLGIRTIYCQRVIAKGVGAALLDRLERAAAR